MRNIVGLVAGAAAGFVGTSITVRIGGMLYPVRADPNIENRLTQLREAMSSAPIEAQLFIAGAFLAGGLVAALVAKWISGRNWPGMTAAAIVAVMAILVVLVLPLPGWIQAGAVILPLIGGFIGNHLIRSRRTEADTTVVAGNG